VAGEETGSSEEASSDSPPPEESRPLTPPPGFLAASATGSEPEPIDDSLYDRITAAFSGTTQNAELAHPATEDSSAMNTSSDDYRDLFEENTE